MDQHSLFSPPVSSFLQESIFLVFIFYLEQGGIVYSCGTAKKGALGLYDATTAKKPEKVSQISKIIKIACGNAHSVALASDGKVYSWGDPAEGALGHGELNYSEKLQARQGSPRLMDHNYISRCRFIDVAAGHTHTALLSGIFKILLFLQS